MKAPTSMRYWVANSPHPIASMARRLRAHASKFTLPAPHLIVRPYLWLFLGLRGIVFSVRRLLVAEPLFKAYCSTFGKGVTTGIYVPWVQGKGDLVVGDYVHISGKLNITFAARFVKRPRLTLGDYTDIGHDTRFVVGREIRIGSNVQIAGGVAFRDSGGHPSDPELRKAGAPPDEADVKSIIVHDNVWIGSGVSVLPGTEIGEGSIVVAHSVISGTVAPYTVVAGNPARRISTLTPPPGREHLVVAAPKRKPTAPVTADPVADSSQDSAG